MSMLVRLIAVACAVTVTAILLDAGRALAQESGETAALRSELLSHSYLEAVTNCRFVTFSADESLQDGVDKLYLKMLRTQNQVQERPLTEGEQRRLAVWYKPQSGCTLLSATLMLAAEYFDEFGELPPDGLALYPELRTLEGLQALAALSDAAAVAQYCDAIDPITGRFYASFSAEQWQPAAMKLRLVSDPEELERIDPHYGVPINEYTFVPAAEEGGEPAIVPQYSGEYVKPIKAMYITVYGEKPGSILYDGLHWQGPNPVITGGV
jgi:hypothetical protein